MDSTLMSVAMKDLRLISAKLTLINKNSLLKKEKSLKTLLSPKKSLINLNWPARILSQVALYIYSFFAGVLIISMLCGISLFFSNKHAAELRKTSAFEKSLAIIDRCTQFGIDVQKSIKLQDMLNHPEKEIRTSGEPLNIQPRQGEMPKVLPNGTARPP